MFVIIGNWLLGAEVTKWVSANSWQYSIIDQMIVDNIKYKSNLGQMFNNIQKIK